VQAFPDGGSYEMIIAPGGTMIGGYARPRASERAQWLSFASVHDVDATVRAAVAAGGTIVVPPSDMNGVGRMARIADPQGAELWVSHNDGGDPPDVTQAADGTFFWNELHTTSAVDAVAFYTKVLGMKEIGRSPIGATTGATASLVSEEGGPVLELNYYPEASRHATKYIEGSELDHLAFQVEDLDKALSEAKRLGRPTVLEMKTSTSRWAFIRDPNGIYIELFA